MTARGRRPRINATGRSASGFVRIGAKVIDGEGGALFRSLTGDAWALFLELMRINRQEQTVDKGCRYIAKATGLDPGTVARRIKELIGKGALVDLSGSGRRSRSPRRLELSSRLRMGKRSTVTYIAIHNDELRSRAFRELPGAAKKALPVLRLLAVDEGADPVGGSAEVRISGGALGPIIGMSSRTAGRALKALVAAGFIECVEEPAWGEMTRPGLYLVAMRPSLVVTGHRVDGGHDKSASHTGQKCNASSPTARSRFVDLAETLTPARRQG